MTISLNDTTAYHLGERASLGWEQTISECLKDIGSPYMEALKTRRSYGDIVADLLESRGMIGGGLRVLEVGGGYGSLARSLLARYQNVTMTMVDISPIFLVRQREALSPFGGRATFVHADIFEYLETCGDFDLIVSNENMGDLPAVVDIPKDALMDFIGGRMPPRGPGDNEARYLGQARDFIERLDIDLFSAPRTIHLNTGAVRFVELAAKKTDRLFLAEHSSDWSVSPRMEGFFRDTRADQWPHKIMLFGHTEVTIRFDHLRGALTKIGRFCETGRLADLLSVRDDPEIRYILISGSIQSERHELIGEFLDHVKEYQWLMTRR